MKQNKVKTNSLAITFFVFSVLLLLVFLFNIYFSYDYLKQFEVEFATAWKEIFNVYFTSCIPAFVGAVVCYGIGVIINKSSQTNELLEAILMDVQNHEDEEEEDDIDEMFASAIKKEEVVEEPETETSTEEQEENKEEVQEEAQTEEVEDKE